MAACSATGSAAAAGTWKGLASHATSLTCCAAACVPLQAAVIGIANIYYGILYMWVLGVWAWASYTAVLAAIVAVSLVKDTSSWMRWVILSFVVIESLYTRLNHRLHTAR